MDTECETMLDASRTRFDLNMGRVENLVEIFERLEEDNAKSRDVLRAAVMLLHASLEDVLRQLLLYRLPKSTSVEMLRMFFTDQHGKAEKMEIGELARLHKVKVEREIRSRMTKKLSNSNYGDRGDVIAALKILGFDENDLKPRVEPLGELMSRRHLIVHRSDREEAIIDNGDGRKRTHGRPRKINTDTVKSWLKSVRKLVNYVIANIDRPPKLKKSVKVKLGEKK
jgi:hypothetical protein